MALGIVFFIFLICRYLVFSVFLFSLGTAQYWASSVTIGEAQGKYVSVPLMPDQYYWRCGFYSS
jgi:hypothetical protein